MIAVLRTGMIAVRRGHEARRAYKSGDSSKGSSIGKGLICMTPCTTCHAVPRHSESNYRRTEVTIMELRYLVDVVFDPGALYEVASHHVAS